MIKKASTTDSKKSSPIQLWYGDNKSMIQLEVQSWVDLFRDKYPQAKIVKLNYKVSEAGELLRDLNQAARGGGFFATKKLVILTDFLKVETKTDLSDLLKQLVASLPEDLVLLLIETGKVAWSKGLGATIKNAAEEKQVTLREFKNLDSSELEKWIEARVKKEGGKMASGVARLLSALVGNDFVKLTNEISKLVHYRQGADIRAVDLDTLVTSTMPEDIFVFIEAVGKRDFTAANVALEKQLAQDTSPQQIVAMLGWQLRVLMSVRTALDNTNSRPQARELAEGLGLHPYVVTKALQQIPYYSKGRLVQLYDDLSTLDVKLKSSRQSPKVLLAWFLGKLASLKVGR